MPKLKVALGDLRHRTTGRHSVFMPIGIGFIGAYLLQKSPRDTIELRLYDDADILLADIDRWKPDVIGLSNYCWNSNLSCLVYRYAKEQNPQTLCISGGPDFPSEEYKCVGYLSERPEIDFYVYREGEVAFCNLVNKVLEEKVLKGVAHAGVMSLGTTGDLLKGDPVPRLKSLDEIPSPYTLGLMDQFFNGEYAPCMEFARGCPFTCGYCYASQKWYSRITRFSIERVEADLNYIATRMREYPNVLLSICDSNFGMYKEDEKIADHIAYLQDTYGWPNAFDVTTGKAHYDRIIGVVKKLKNTMKVACSAQTMNADTLKVIKRHNMPVERYKLLVEEIKNLNMMSGVGLIIPMPLETKETFFEGIKLLFESGVESFVIYTTMLLNSTYLSHDDCRKTYRYQTRFRIIPRQFGKYAGVPCFEIEEVCISTDTMSFDDYLDCRGFAFLVALVSSEQFDIVRRHLKELGIASFDYLYALWELVAEGKTEISQIYKEYLEETKSELFTSRQAIYDYYKMPVNYEKLVRGDLGDNLVRKYVTMILLNKCDDAFALTYSVLRTAQESPTEVVTALSAAESWVRATRNVAPVFRGELEEKRISFDYDVGAWYSAVPQKPLVEYKGQAQYDTYYNSEKLQSIIGEAIALYGKDLSYVVGKILTNWSIKNFWAQIRQTKTN